MEQQGLKRSVPSTLDCDQAVDGLSIRDLVRMASLNLRASSKKYGDGYRIEVRNHNDNLMTRISLSHSEIIDDGTNYKFENLKLRESIVTSGYEMKDLTHLYITWDSPGKITFCYAAEGRYTCVDINKTGSTFVSTAVDRRTNEKPMTDEEKEDKNNGRNQRRTFYHIGNILETVSVK